MAETPAVQSGSAVSKSGAERNIDPRVPALVAQDALTRRLPPSVDSWLNAMAYHSLVVASVGGKAPAAPQLTVEEMTTCRSELAIVDLVTRPAHTKGAELMGDVAKFLSIWPFGLRHDASLMQAKVSEWCTELEGFPLYAIRRALDWWKRHGKEEPSLSSVLDDVKLFVGDGVLERKRLLERLVA